MQMAKEFQEAELLTGNVFRARQLDSLDEIYRRAKDNTPFYKKKYAGCSDRIESFDQFSSLPILDRAEVAENYKDMVVGGIDNPNVVLSRTGGSSGEPLTFYTFKGSAAVVLAMMIRARAWWDIDHNEKSALFIEHGLKFEDDWQARVEQFFHHIREKIVNRIFLSAYKMSNDNMAQYYKDINNFSPVYFIGYASFLYLFARYLKDNNLPGAGLGVQCIFYTSEMLYPWQRQVIEEVFGCPVVGEYGLKEVGIVAYECPSRRWHTMDDSVYVELVPLKSDPTMGEVVVTQLLNMDSPLIRYRTGDIAQIVDREEPCPCGRGLNLMGNMQGRSHDWIATPSGKRIHGQVFTHALIVRGSVDKFQVHQEKDFSIGIKVVANNKFGKDEETKIVEAIKEVLGEPVNIRVEKVEYISSGNSGKFRWIKSEISVFDRETKD
jgi:phenylacetate-coenzyme A ligase PaaK-like adenylate-forming protein